MFKEDQNPFEVLGIKPTFEVDATVLEAAYFGRQALVHPDRFIYHAAPERQAASQQASLLNHAYETLKNPTLRAKALLKLRGIDVEVEEGKTVQDPQILEEMMSLQEALAEAISPHDLEALDYQIQERFQGVMVAFSGALQQEKSQQLSPLFLRLTYLAKLREDLKIRRRQSSVKVL